MRWLDNQEEVLYIHAFYPNYIRVFRADFLSEFEFIRFEGRIIITFIKMIIRKGLTMNLVLNGDNTRVISRTPDMFRFVEYNFHRLGMVYSTNTINSIIWEQT